MSLERLMNLDSELFRIIVILVFPFPRGETTHCCIQISAYHPHGRLRAMLLCVMGGCGPWLSTGLIQATMEYNFLLVLRQVAPVF